MKKLNLLCVIFNGRQLHILDVDARALQQSPSHRVEQVRLIFPLDDHKHWRMARIFHCHHLFLDHTRFVELSVVNKINNQ